MLCAYRRRGSLPLLVPVLALFFATAVQAETNKSWVGGTSTAWGTAENWDPIGMPTAAENAQFSGAFTGANSPQVQTSQASTVINGIWMTGTPGRTVTVTRSSSNGLTITPTDTINGISGLGILVDNSDASVLDLRVPIALGANQEWRNTTNVTVSMTNSASIISGSGNLTLRSTGSAFSSAFRVDGRAETFTGQLTVAEGIYRVTVANNVNANGPLGNAGSASPVILGDAGDKLGAIRVGSASSTSNKPFTLASGGRGGFWVDHDTTTPTLTLSGKISGGGKLVKLGGSDLNTPTTLELTNSNNDWAGGTLITDGFISIPTGNRLADGVVTFDYDPQYLSNTGQGHSNMAGMKFTGDTTLTAPIKSIVVNPGVGAVGGVLDVAASTTTTLAGDGALSGSGNLAKAGNGALKLTGDNSGFTGNATVGAGTLLVDGTQSGGGAYSVASGATLGGSGSIGSSNVTVDAGGILSPGDSLGMLTVGGANLFGTLQIGYSGNLGSTSVLNVANNLDIGSATLSFNNLDATSLTGQSHVLASYGSLSGGSFLSVAGLPAGYSLDYDYQNNHQIALVFTPGDFDGNGIVDGADFAVWQTGFPTTAGATLQTGDADGDGDVDGADFVVWQTHFSTSASSSAVATVPEPTAMMLVICAAIAVSLRQFGHRAKLNSTLRHVEVRLPAHWKG